MGEGDLGSIKVRMSEGENVVLRFELRDGGPDAGRGRDTLTRGF